MNMLVSLINKELLLDGWIIELDGAAPNTTRKTKTSLAKNFFQNFEQNFPEFPGHQPSGKHVDDVKNHGGKKSDKQARIHSACSRMAAQTFSMDKCRLTTVTKGQAVICCCKSASLL